MQGQKDHLQLVGESKGICLVCLVHRGFLTCYVKSLRLPNLDQVSLFQA